MHHRALKRGEGFKLQCGHWCISAIRLGRISGWYRFRCAFTEKVILAPRQNVLSIQPQQNKTAWWQFYFNDENCNCCDNNSCYCFWLRQSWGFRGACKQERLGLHFGRGPLLAPLYTYGPSCSRSNPRQTQTWISVKYLKKAVSASTALVTSKCIGQATVNIIETIAKLSPQQFWFAEAILTKHFAEETKLFSPWAPRSDRPLDESFNILCIQNMQL